MVTAGITINLCSFSLLLLCRMVLRWIRLYSWTAISIKVICACFRIDTVSSFFKKKIVQNQQTRRLCTYWSVTSCKVSTLAILTFPMKRAGKSPELKKCYIYSSLFIVGFDSAVHGASFQKNLNQLAEGLDKHKCMRDNWRTTENSKSCSLQSLCLWTNFQLYGKQRLKHSPKSWHS